MRPRLALDREASPHRPTQNHRAPMLCAFAVMVATLVVASVEAFQTVPLPPIPVLTGTYRADDGAIYYVQRSSDTLSWVGMSMDPGLTPDRQWHRGLAFTNVFRGTIRSDRTIAGEWSDVPRGSSLHNGTLTVRFDADRTIVRLTKVAGTGPFGATSWIKIDPIDDTMFEKAPA